jgi:uncharacterized protein (DUF1499 family)
MGSHYVAVPMTFPALSKPPVGISTWLTVALAASLAGCASAPSAPPAPPDELTCGWLPNCVSSVADNPAPLRFSGTLLQARTRLLVALAAMPEATVKGGDGARVDVVFETSAGFRDDVTFRIDVERQRIDYRSRSQAGLYDFGKNRSRMAAFAAAFDKVEAR